MEQAGLALSPVFLCISSSTFWLPEASFCLFLHPDIYLLTSELIDRLFPLLCQMSHHHHNPIFPILPLTIYCKCVQSKHFTHSYQQFIKLLVLPSFHAEIEKEKLCSSEDVEGGGAGAPSAGGGSGGGGVSASLTPAIWEKTIPYDGETFHLEYMDLDEFLLENGIPVTLEEEELQKSFPSVAGKGKSIPKVTATATATTTITPPAAAAAPVSVSTSASSPSVSTTPVVNSDPEETVTVTTLQPAKLEEEEEGEEEEEEEGEGQEEEDSLSEEATAEVELKEKRTGEKLIFVVCF